MLRYLFALLAFGIVGGHGLTVFAQRGATLPGNGPPGLTSAGGRECFGSRWWRRRVRVHCVSLDQSAT